jgi:signal transduction histidine kinase
MSLTGRIARRVRHPHTTVRWRLTLLYGGLFLVCGAGLLAITYGLVSHSTTTAAHPRSLYVRGALAIPRPFLQGRTTKVQGPFPGQIHQVRSRVAPKILQALRSTQGKAVVNFVVSSQRVSDLHQLEVESAIALAIMAIIAGLLGWVVAGRVLRPLRTITAATREISEANLHRRLALAGPPDELRQLADTIDELLMRLERAFEAQRRFVANASHELRTPLTTVRALLELVLSDPHANLETFREACRHVLEENEQEERLIDALLTLAQGQRGVEHAEEVDLAALGATVAKAQKPQAASRGLSLDTDLEPATIAGDPRLIERLVSNLVENAVRYNVAHGNVSLTVATQNGHAVLEVANSGPVVPPDQVERLLQPFQRMGAERVSVNGANGDGLGLGLSIVSAIAVAHEAALEVQPQENGGLDIVVRFPAAHAPTH